MLSENLDNETNKKKRKESRLLYINLLEVFSVQVKKLNTLQQGDADILGLVHCQRKHLLE